MILTFGTHCDCHSSNVSDKSYMIWQLCTYPCFINVNLRSKGLVVMWKSVRRKEFLKSADREVSFFATSFKKFPLEFINYEDNFWAFFWSPSTPQKRWHFIHMYHINVDKNLTFLDYLLTNSFLRSLATTALRNRIVAVSKQ